MGKINKRIYTFLILVVLFCAFPYYKIISLGMNKSHMYVFMLMWAPTASALITKLIYDKTLKGLGFKLGKIKYIGISYVIPLLAGCIVYFTAWITGIGGFNNSRSLKYLIVFCLIGPFISLLSATGEEIGWRGFLVPELFKKFSYTKTSIITGVIWALYHYPLVLFSDYNSGTSILASIIFFTISVFSICFITTFLRIKSGSLWTGAVLHASHNFFIQAVFDVMTLDNGKTKLFTTEFGCGLALVYSIVALYFWRRRRELDKLF